MREAVRVGIIGRGRWGLLYAATLRECGAQAAWVCGKADLRYDADAVIIATPAATHYELAKTAMSRGCHVLAEKPLALSYAHASELCCLAEQSRRVAWVGHTHTFSPTWRAFKERLAGAKNGLVHFGGPCPAPKWWCKGSHAVSLALDLFGECRSAAMTGDRLRLEFDDGRNCLVLVDDGVVRPHVVADGERFDARMTVPSPMQVLVGEFLQAVRIGRADASGFALGRRVAAVCSVCPA